MVERRSTEEEMAKTMGDSLPSKANLEGQRTNEIELRIIGTFLVESGELAATDPCYTKDTWCAAFGIPARNGKWIARAMVTDANDWGRRISYLEAYNEKYMNSEKNHKWKRHKATIGVDSGQAGLFDSKYYPNDKECDEDFYYKCSQHTLSDKSCGIVDNRGVVSSTGYGDGSYTLYTKEVDGKVVAARISYMPWPLGRKPDEDQKARKVG